MKEVRHVTSAVRCHYVQVHHCTCILCWYLLNVSYALGCMGRILTCVCIVMIARLFLSMCRVMLVCTCVSEWCAHKCTIASHAFAAHIHYSTQELAHDLQGLVMVNQASVHKPWVNVWGHQMGDSVWLIPAPAPQQLLCYYSCCFQVWRNGGGCGTVRSLCN